jgi:hypothetical protein
MGISFAASLSPRVAQQDRAEMSADERSTSMLPTVWKPESAAE